MKNTQLLIIDPQEDFCNPKGPMAVGGADEDMRRLAKFINKNQLFLDDIKVTLDTHRELDVAHAIYWEDQNGNHPDPFTIISVDDVTGDSPKWRPVKKEWTDQAIEYVKGLAESGKYPLCIWPTHCVIGSKGHSVFSDLMPTLSNWERNSFKQVDYTLKGMNIHTENYSVFKAEVPDEEDPATQWNQELAEDLLDTSLLLVAGEALSHCVASSVRDLLEVHPNLASKMIIISDCTSSVPGFENLGEQFKNDMEELGVKFLPVDEVEKFL